MPLSMSDTRLAVNSRNLVALAGLCVVLMACDSARTEFVEGCMAKGQSEQACRCSYDLAKETLPENYFAIFAAQVGGDSDLADREMAKLTLPERLGYAARAVEVTAIAAGQCPAG